MAKAKEQIEDEPEAPDAEAPEPEAPALPDPEHELNPDVYYAPGVHA